MDFFSKVAFQFNFLGIRNRVLVSALCFPVGLAFGTLLSTGDIISALLVGILYFVGIYGSVGFHEYAHALMANKITKNSIEEIDYLVFGGMAKMTNAFFKQNEFLVTVVGPLSSLFLFVVFSIIGGFVDHSIINFLTLVNLLLFSFNCLPIFPMDGGRILRSVLTWKFNFEYFKATKVAFYSSIGVAILASIYYVGQGDFFPLFIFGFILMMSHSEFKNVKAIKELKSYMMQGLVTQTQVKELLNQYDFITLQIFNEV